MVKMGNVWDRTVEVLNGRTGMIGSFALLGLFLPSVMRDAYVAAGTPGTIGFALIGLTLSMIALLAMIWAQLAIIAVATHPSTMRADAAHQGRARLGPAFGITMLLGLIAGLAALPPMIGLVLSGFDFAAASRGAATMTPPSAGTAVFVSLYFLVYGLFVIWAVARLALLNAVILNERLGVGAIRRSFALTRGLTWRIIGVVVLFAIVLVVATAAAQAVTGVIFRLVLGASGKGLAAFLADVAGTLVTTGFSALAAVFTAQLYVATAGTPTSE
ncbi:hypothetical protein FSB78_01725 [Sphingomonas ginsenosidivorax]|uniref:Glycerophosphoryl diester phosphodiesterase membrane domain-containing protein n=1 Tax=Sphingomonas ginsenosidivorax TaxID=862135 RepID=A0A5C6UA42_9SPHN|nr:hypothetical protein [Sphingomonas ginsenosidivorax]TXC69817.1 hypothetical protein FSB78_01725 [Sphingomonas ginsenosidivorax]